MTDVTEWKNRIPTKDKEVEIFWNGLSADFYFAGEDVVVFVPPITFSEWMSEVVP